MKRQNDPAKMAISLFRRAKFTEYLIAADLWLTLF